MRALVLGGSGHLGNAAVRELLARGAKVSVARRGRTPAHNLSGLAVHDLNGDADDALTLHAWFAEHTLVVDAAAPIPLTLSDAAAVERAVRRAQVLVDAVQRHATRLVHIGSFFTRLGTDDEGRPRHPVARLEHQLHPYFRAKQRAEAVLLDAVRAGVPIAIVHPTACLGPWDSRPPRMCLVANVLAGLVPVAPEHVVNVIDVRDVARGLVAVATARDVGDAPVRLTGHNISIPELCNLISELAGVHHRTRGVPALFARAGAWALELALPGVLPAPLLVTLLSLRHRMLPVSSEQRALGVVPRPLSATLRDAIAWHRGQRDADRDHWTGVMNDHS